MTMIYDKGIHLKYCNLEFCLCCLEEYYEWFGLDKTWALNSYQVDLRKQKVTQSTNAYSAS